MKTTLHKANIKRLLAVAELIRSGYKCNALQIAARLSVCDKTIYRDIDLLKDLGAPLIFRPTNPHSVDHVPGGYWEWLWTTPNLPWYFGGPNNKPRTT